MRSRKVFRIYAALNEEERTAFGLYLASPYFNASARLLHFRELLEEELVRQPERFISVEEVWRRLPDVTTEFRPNGFDKLCSDLLNALNDFLTVHEFRSDSTRMASLQLHAYVERHLDEWVPNLYDGLLERLGKDLERDADGLYSHLTMLHAYGRYLFRQERMPEAAQLLRIDQKLNEFFFARKLELAAALDAYGIGYQSQLQLLHMDWMRNAFETGMQDYPEVIQVQALGWLMMHTQNQEYYVQLKMKLKDRWHILPANEARYLYLLLLNFCIAQLNMENDAFETELDGLYLDLVDNGLLLNDGKLAAGHFKNIVQMRLRLGKMDWVEGFIGEWKEKVGDADGSALRYNQAVLAFYQGRFAACLREMDMVLRDYKSDIHYGSDARIYVLMALFELNKAEDWGPEFAARLNAFRLYLIRDEKMGPVKKQRLLNVVKQFRKLMSLTNELPENKLAKAQKFLAGLKNLKPAANRKWFEQQVSDMVREG
jgi:hypothetical protein